jgi:hypothetical protein
VWSASFGNRCCFSHGGNWLARTGAYATSSKHPYCLVSGNDDAASAFSTPAPAS